MTARRAALVTLVTAAALLLGTAGPATAADGLTVDITSPGEGAVLDGPDVIVKGTATTSGLYRMNGVSVQVTSVTNPGTFGCDRSCDGTSGGHSATFSYGRRLDFNGPYTVTVTAYDTLPLVGGERSTAVQRRFKVEVPPAAPRDVKVEAG
ncbi:MAG TPA: hypothetical protein VG455_06720, partial [Acidimicrobiales bacterium]|nr:hypothetical protein [Acidimicrobiales bacterium]